MNKILIALAQAQAKALPEFYFL